MIAFIGLGLWNEKSMSIQALETARDCDILYAEFYTSKLMGTTVEKLERKFGKSINILKRSEIESNTKILNDARTMKVGFLVGGDSLTATTHIELLIDAKKKWH